MEQNFLEKIGYHVREAWESFRKAFLVNSNLAFAGVAFFVFVTALSFVAPPRNFSVQSYIDIEDGATLSEVSQILKEEGYIKSRQLFELFVVVFGRQRGVKAGEYFIANKITSVEFAWRFVRGDTRVAPIIVTLFEGETVAEMAEDLAAAIEGFDPELFLDLADSKEGYLFPDTYHFKRKITVEEVIEILETTFLEKTEDLLPMFEESGKSIDDIVIMASILENEASNNYEEKQVIAGILWKRMSIDMPLQVDATLKYITGRGSAQLTTEDLRDDHPYNTYTNRGLPPGPIGNPGVDAMKAAANPKTSEYLFYLHGKDGQVRYARTHDQHVDNKRRYLR
jgi:UPF0755 protein